MDKSVAAEHPRGAVRGDSWMWSTCTVCGVSSSATQNNAATFGATRCFRFFVGLLLKSGGSCLGRCFLKRWDPFFFFVGKPRGEKIGPTVVTLEEPKRKICGVFFVARNELRSRRIVGGWSFAKICFIFTPLFAGNDMIQNLTFARSYLFSDGLGSTDSTPNEVPHQETLFKAPHQYSGRRPVDWPNISVMRKKRQEEEHGSNRRSWRLDFEFLFWFWFSKRSRWFFVLVNVFLFELAQ